MQFINDSHMTFKRKSNWTVTYWAICIVLAAKTTTHSQQSDLNCYARLNSLNLFKTQLFKHVQRESCKIPQLHRKYNLTGLVTRHSHIAQRPMGSINSVSKSTAKSLVSHAARLVNSVDFKLFLCYFNVFSELCRCKYESSKFQVFTELGEYHVFFEIRIRGTRVLQSHACW